MNDLQYRRASDVYLQFDPHQKPPPVTEPYQPFDDDIPLDKRDHQNDDGDYSETEYEDESDGW